MSNPSKASISPNKIDAATQKLVLFILSNEIISTYHTKPFKPKPRDQDILTLTNNIMIFPNKPKTTEQSGSTLTKDITSLSAKPIKHKTNEPNIPTPTYQPYGDPEK